MLQFDEALLRLVNNLSGHEPWDWLMRFFTTIGYGGAIWIALALVLLIGAGRLPGLKHKGSNRWRTVAMAMLLALAVGRLVEVGLKEVVNRQRPPLSLAQVRVLESLPESPSFPSGHAVSSFAGATVLFTASRRLKQRGVLQISPLDGWVSMALAVLISFSRIYVGHHYPLDVLAGAALGIIIGWLTWRGLELALRNATGAASTLR